MEQADAPTIVAGEKRKWTEDVVEEPKKEKQRIVGKDGKVMVCELSRTRRVSVGQFAGKKLVDIREYYEKDGEMFPGKKGISLTVDQFQLLKEHIPDIEEELYEDKS